jgi:hypothetical protein
MPRSCNVKTHLYNGKLMNEYDLHRLTLKVAHRG